jgi:MoxR-like ATPase
MTVLQESKAHHVTWELGRLVDKVANDTGWLSLPELRRSIKTLVQAGTLSGVEQGATIRNIRLLDEEQPQSKPTSPPSNGGNSQWAQQQQQVHAAQKKAIEEQTAVISKLQDELKATAAQRDQMAKEALKKPNPVLEVRLVKEDGKVEKKMKGVFHKQFRKILQLAQMRKNIFIYGPTGCGKSHICAQVAEALNLNFAFISCTAGMSEGQLGGRLLPVGKQGTFEYVTSEFIKCYEEGGLFLLDEIDAADPNVLLLVNAALANGHIAVPNRPEKPYAKRHKDFVCAAAANTVGTGADRLYSGRNKLDAATLDRFQIGKVCMDYDEEVEKQLCPDDELRSRLLRYRRAVMANRLERAISSRFLRDAYDMKTKIKWTDAEIDEALFSGWREDEVAKVKSYKD